jgi:hypothetical protein
MSKQYSEDMNDLISATPLLATSKKEVSLASGYGKI